MRKKTQSEPFSTASDTASDTGRRAFLNNFVQNGLGVIDVIEYIKYVKM